MQMQQWKKCTICTANNLDKTEFDFILNHVFELYRVPFQQHHKFECKRANSHVTGSHVHYNAKLEQGFQLIKYKVTRTIGHTSHGFYTNFVMINSIKLFWHFGWLTNLP